MHKGTTMVRKKLVDHNALIQAIEMGQDKQDIMQKFGYKSLGALKIAYLDALVALEKVPDVKKGGKQKKVDNIVGVNSRGSLVIPKKLVEALDLDQKALFRVEKEGAGLCLKVSTTRPKTILRKKQD